MNNQFTNSTKSLLRVMAGMWVYANRRHREAKARGDQYGAAYHLGLRDGMYNMMRMARVFAEPLPPKPVAPKAPQPCRACGNLPCSCHQFNEGWSRHEEDTHGITLAD